MLGRSDCLLVFVYASWYGLITIENMGFVGEGAVAGLRGYDRKIDDGFG